MTRISWIATAFGLAIVLGVVGGLVTTSFSGSKDAGESHALDEPVQVVLEGSQPIKYQSLADIGNAADVVIVGTVKEAAVVEERPHPEIRVITTLYDFGVEEVLKGTLQESSIPVLQLGGVTPTEVQELSDDPLFSREARYVLFLDYVPETQRYHTVGGHQGRLVVNDDLASSLSAVYPARDIEDLDIAAMNISEVRERIR